MAGTASENTGFLISGLGNGNVVEIVVRFMVSCGMFKGKEWRNKQRLNRASTVLIRRQFQDIICVGPTVNAPSMTGHHSTSHERPRECGLSV